jgi:hypothetical protein
MWRPQRIPPFPSPTAPATGPDQPKPAPPPGLAAPRRLTPGGAARPARVPTAPRGALNARTTARPDPPPPRRAAARRRAGRAPHWQTKRRRRGRLPTPAPPPPAPNGRRSYPRLSVPGHCTSTLGAPALGTQPPARAALAPSAARAARARAPTVTAPCPGAPRPRPLGPPAPAHVLVWNLPLRQPGTSTSTEHRTPRFAFFERPLSIERPFAFRSGAGPGAGGPQGGAARGAPHQSGAASARPRARSSAA